MLLHFELAKKEWESLNLVVQLLDKIHVKNGQKQLPAIKVSKRYQYDSRQWMFKRIWDG